MPLGDAGDDAQVFPVPGARSPAPGPLRILGIDPGSQRTGVGVIEADPTGKLRCVFRATLKVAGEETFALRLKRIYDELSDIIAAHAPSEAAIERVFMAKNADSALKLGQARGAAICAAVGCGLPVSEYAPNAIKQAVVGKGHAGKEQVQHMVGIEAAQVIRERSPGAFGLVKIGENAQ